MTFSFALAPSVKKMVSFLGFAFILLNCTSKEEEKAVVDLRIKSLDSAMINEYQKAINAEVSYQLADGLELSIWAVDSLVADPVSVDIDDFGKLYYTRTNRQKNSEFDIRRHQDWEIESIRIQSLDDKRAFLKNVLAPEKSSINDWLADLNGDGSRDWRDLTVEKEHVYRVEDTSGDGLADVSQLVIEDFHEEVTDAAGGVLKYGDDLFVGIGPDLWKLNDENDDGLIDEKKSLSRGYGLHVGYSGHGMSGIEVGPEGKIYWQIGDIGFNGSTDGQAPIHANSGVIVRANPDGSDFEVFAYGNRNTHEFAFDEYGNLISVDNDGDHPGERERIVYVVNGADLGWRINWQFGKYRDPDNNTYKVWMDEKLHLPRFEGQAAYITPAIAPYVDGPTGMIYNPGTALGKAWKNYFFVAEFVGNPAQSGIHAFKLTPEGASFKLAESKEVLSGILATGIDFGPDGAMYIGDWIDGWGTKNHGRIWKLDGTDVDDAVRKQVRDLLKADFSDYKPSALGDLLKHEDMRVRQKAQFELAARGEAGMTIFKGAFNQKEHQLARIHAIWGVSQLARKNIKHASVLVPLLKDSDAEVRAQAAKWIGDVRYKDAASALLPLLQDTASRVRFFAAEALGRIKDNKAVDALITLLEDNDDKDAYIRHAASLALARIGDADALVSLARHPSEAVRLGAVVALRRMRHEGVATFLTDKSQYVVTEAARAINDDLSIEEALPALGDALVSSSFTNEAFVRRAINANLRTGTEKALKNLMSYAANVSNPATMRAEALAALGTWVRPSVLDRVDGRYRGEVKRDSARVRELSGEGLIALLSDQAADVRYESVKAIGRLGINQASSNLFAKLKSDPDARVREEAIKALAMVKDEDITSAIQLALQDRQKSVRAAALDLLPEMNLSEDLKISLLENVINTKTIQEKQTALEVLGAMPPEKTNAVLERLISKLQSKKLPMEVSLELESAIEQSGDQTLMTRYRSVASASATDTLKAAFAGALFGGNADEGAKIFYSHQAAQCIRCHAIGDMGGNAGPPLNGIASRLSREQLLEALIDPNERLAPGYGMVTVDLKGGEKVSGVLVEDKANFIRLKVGSKPDTVIQQSDIAKRTYAMSSMPPMRILLSKKEIRDVVSFLSTLERSGH